MLIDSTCQPIKTIHMTAKLSFIHNFLTLAIRRRFALDRNLRGPGQNICCAGR